MKVKERRCERVRERGKEGEREREGERGGEDVLMPSQQSVSLPPAQLKRAKQTRENRRRHFYRRISETRRISRLKFELTQAAAAIASYVVLRVAPN